MRRDSSIISGVRTAIPLILVGAGIVELVITIIVITGNPSSWTLTAMNLPSSFLPITLAVIFATWAPAAKALRAVIAVAAIVFAGVRLGLVVALFATRPDAGEWLMGVISGSQTNQISLGISVVTGTLMGLALAGWACLEWLRPVAARRTKAAQAAPIARAAPQTFRARADIHHQQGPKAHWHEGATPWPRRVEEDSNGTLIRPPRSGR